MRYGNKPGKVEKLVGGSGFFYRQNPKVGHFSYIFLNFIAVFLFMRITENCGKLTYVSETPGRIFTGMRGEARRPVKKRLLNCLLPKFALNPAIFMSRRTIFLSYAAAEFCLFLSKPSHVASTVSGGGRIFYARGIMENYWKVSEVAAAIQVSVQTVYRYVANGEIPFHKLNKAVRFKPSEIESWMESRKAGVTMNQNGNTGGEGE
jgi:excisionase family DNA binding protein